MCLANVDRRERPALPQYQLDFIEELNGFKYTRGLQSTLCRMTLSEAEINFLRDLAKREFEAKTETMEDL